MVTDWVLVRRLALELEERLGGARVIDAGRLPDGRTALVLRARGRQVLLAMDLFESPPLLTVESAGQELTPQPGFVRTLQTALCGMTLAKVAARHADRLLRFEFQARSRFGVGSSLELYVELVPRFGNAVLVKGETIVAAAKEFSPSENPARAVMAGSQYALPPLRNRAAAHGAALADSGDALRAPLFVYRRGGAVVQAHVVALPAPPDTQVTREPSLIEIFGELRVQRAGENASLGAQRRRRTLLERLDRREGKLLGELRRIEEKRAKAAARDELRLEGEAIFASLHERPERERAEAKQRAAELFARYKKLATALEHLFARERRVLAWIDAVRTLRWEAERSADEAFGDVEDAVAALEPRGRSRPATRKRKRAPLELHTLGGSRIFVGRSPYENAQLTFRIARPHDLWFHARGIPGAHVVLARDDRTAPPLEDLQAAAALAAFHSKAREGRSVAVDYMQRKHVRKQADAPPGLVWYTHAKTITTQPDAKPGAIVDRALA
jgi:predicted ribosome quality control (RQC) complex YloA/Tae2 family protein